MNRLIDAFEGLFTAAARCNHNDIRVQGHADPDTVMALDPDVVVIATGGRPDLEWLEGYEHCDSVWDILSGESNVKKSVLLYDELGDHAGASCAEVLGGSGK